MEKFHKRQKQKTNKTKSSLKKNYLKDLYLLKKLNSCLKNHPTKKIPVFSGLIGRFNQTCKEKITPMHPENRREKPELF